MIVQINIKWKWQVRLPKVVPLTTLARHTGSKRKCKHGKTKEQTGDAWNVRCVTEARDAVVEIALENAYTSQRTSQNTSTAVPARNYPTIKDIVGGGSIFVP